jgi:hypothetical protein
MSSCSFVDRRKIRKPRWYRVSVFFVAYIFMYREVHNGTDHFGLRNKLLKSSETPPLIYPTHNRAGWS